MGIGAAFNSPILNKSLFNKQSYFHAIGQTNKDGEFQNGYAVVRIKPQFQVIGGPKLPEIIGVFNTADGGDYSFNIESSWAPMEGVVGDLIPGVSDFIKKGSSIANIFGASTGAEVYASKKIYQKSGYLTLKIPMMVVDWNATGQPLMTALLLSTYCLPSDALGEEFKKLMGELDDMLNQSIENMKESENRVEKTAGNLVGAGKNMAEGAVIKVKDLLQQTNDFIQTNEYAKNLQYLQSNVVGDFGELFTLRSSPAPVEVQIGKFFSNKDMIIEGLDWTFSKEMTEAGPIYAKFNLNLSTRTILSSPKSIGLTIKPPSRWTETFSLT